MSVVLFPGHKWHACSKPGCGICMFELRVCTICGCSEMSLPTHCPQGPVGYDMQGAIMQGTIDFKNGEWIATSLNLRRG